MKNLEGFLNQNKIKTPNVFYAASKDFIDEEGKPLEWELRKLTTKENNKIRNEAMKISAKEQDVEFDQRLYTSKLYAAAVVYPDLKNIELQNSYGVMGEENLLEAMLDPKEFDDLGVRINILHGFGTAFSDKVEEAKN